MTPRQAFASGAAASALGWVAFWWAVAWVVLPQKRAYRGESR